MLPDVPTSTPLSGQLALSPKLFGRDAQVAVLRHTLAAAQAGQGRCLMLAGEAGVGKSRLVAEAKTRAAPLGITILQGACFEPDRTMPFAPLVDLLEGLCAHRPADEIARLFETTAPDLVKLFPALYTWLPNLTPSPSLDPDQEKRRLFQALSQVLTTVGGRILTSNPGTPPTTASLIIIEDLHWCDDTSLEFLSVFVRRLPTQPIVLLLTYRSDEVGDTLRRFLATLDRGRFPIDEMVVNRLNSQAVHDMIAAIFEQRQPVRHEFVELIHTLTDGNPFFIEETLKALVTSGDIYLERGIWTRKPVSELRIPPSVQDAVFWRVERLNPEARELLQLAAVMGRRFDFAILQTVLQRTEADMLVLIKLLVAAQLVVEETMDQFAFRHALVRQAVYHSLLGRERRPLHRAIAQTIEGQLGRLGDSRAADLAYHFYEAGEWAKTIDYAQTAGERALALYSSHAAVDHFGRACQAAERLQQPPPGSLIYARGQAYEHLGEFEAARADYERCGELAQATGDNQLEWQSLLALGFLWTGHDYPKAGYYFQRALDLASASENPGYLAHTLNRLGNWHMMTDEPGRSIECHQQALAIFEASHDKRGMATTLDLLGISNFTGGDMVNGARHYERAIQLWRDLGERQWLISSLATYATRGGNYLFATARRRPVSLAQCRAEASEALGLARQIGWTNGEVAALLWLGHTLGPRGEWADALQVAQTALDLAQRIEHPLWILTSQAILGAVYLDMGLFPAAEHEFERALDLGLNTRSAYVIYSMAGYLALTRIAQGKLDAAEAALNTLSNHTLPTRTQAQHHMWYGRAELALARHDPRLALDIVDRLIESLGLSPDVTPAGIDLISPRLWLLRGEALAGLRHEQAAETIIRAAAETAAALDAWPLVWRSHAALARLYRGQRRYEEADQEAHRARGVIETLAAKTPEPGQREGFTRYALSLLPPERKLTPRQASRQNLRGLTEREREVAVLISQGKTTRAIAATLTLSERTVEKHIENVMAKLGVETRTQIGVWVAEHGLTRN